MVRALLQVTTGSTAGRQIPISAGQVARFGRTAWADFSFPEDPQMADVHFAVACLPQNCVVRDLETPAGTQVNGEKISQSYLLSGDSITAGGTTFVIQIEGAVQVPDDAMHPARPASPDEATTASAAPAAPETLATRCAKLKLDDKSLALLKPEMSPADYISALLAEQMFPDAVRVLTFVLPATAAAAWTQGSLQTLWGNKVPASQQAALQAVTRWIAEPTEPNRRNAMAAAEAGEFEGSGNLLAAGVFWSGSNIAPAGLPEVVPAAELPAQAMTGALMLAMSTQPPKSVAGLYQQILTAGLEQLAGA